MRKILTLLLPATMFCLTAAAGPKKVHVKTPGTLSELIGKKHQYKIRELKLSGAINGDDIRFLREMAGSDINQQPTPGKLRTIDLTDVTFVPGGGAYVDKEGLYYVTGGSHTLPNFMFRSCPIESVILPARLDTIQTGALEHTALRRIELPDSVCIAGYAFFCDSLLQEVVFPEHISSIGHYAFGGCGMKNISINNIDNVYAYAFAEMPSAETIEINGYVGHMDGYNTFYMCPELRSVDLRGPVVTIGGPTLLADCPRLERFTFHDVVHTISAGAASNCPSFRGYETKNTVLFSNEQEYIPSLPLENVLSNPIYRAATQKIMPVFVQALHRGVLLSYGLRNLNMMAYSEACYQALDGHKDKALDWIEMAAETGWNGYRHMQQDSDLISLHGDPRYEAALQKVKEQGDFILILKQSAPYCTNKTEWDSFTYQPASDSNLVRVREYFNLDSIAGNGDDISRMKNIMYWLHDAIRHDGGSMWPDCPYNAISLYEVCKREGRGLNCRFLAMVLNELYLACGIPSRYLTCQSKAWQTDGDCHVINMAWSRSLNKWVWMDPSFAAFVTDENGLLLHPGEVRERLITDRPLILNEDANWNHESKQTVEGYLKEYMAKNLYFMSARLHSTYQAEGKGGANGRMIYLAPEGFLPFNDTTSDYDYFWQAPQQAKNN